MDILSADIDLGLTRGPWGYREGKEGGGGLVLGIDGIIAPSFPLLQTPCLDVKPALSQVQME